MTPTAKPAPGELLEAISRGNISHAMALLEQGADPNDKNENNKSALHAAMKHKESIDLVRLLVEKGADIETAAGTGYYTPVMLAVHYSNIPALIFLIEKGADLDKKDSRNRTPLDWAKLAGPGFRDIVEILEKAPLQRAEKKKIADLHDMAAARQKNLKNLRPKIVRPS